MAASNSLPNSVCSPTRMLPIFGPSGSIPKARCTRPVVRLRKYFASIRPANPPWFSIPRTFLQAMAFDSRGVLFVGTSPDGKVYRVSASGEKSVFFDPKTKYIWDLSFSPDGTLYVATGDKGQVFAVAPDGKGELFYSSDEAHIRVLAFDSNGNLVAGTEPSGSILRMPPT